MKAKRITTIFFVMFIILNYLYPQNHIENYFNLYEDLQYLKTMGILTNLDLSTLPLEKADVTELLVAIVIPDSLKYLYRFRSMSEKLPYNPSDSVEVIAGLKLKSSKIPDKIKSLSNQMDVLGNGIYTNYIIRNKYLLISNSMFITNSVNEADRDKPHEISGIYAYTNTAYIRGKFLIGNINTILLLGRNYYKIGYSRLGSLFLSDYSRPYDQFQFKLSYRSFSIDLIAIQLENISNARRLLYIHKLSWNINNKYYFSLSEASLNSGPNRNIEFQYFNPIMVWLPDKTAGTTSRFANSFLHFAFSFYPQNEWNIWSELLIDDYQINTDEKSDLEPNEIGVILGLEKVTFPYQSSLFWLQYTAVTNRTYQTPNVEEVYTHKGYPIGYYLGNDFDQIQLYYSQILSRKIKIYGTCSYLRDGANGLDTPFDTPWEDSTITMETGYSEPFPTGPITYVTELETGLDFYFNDRSYFNAGLFWQRKALAGEIENHYSIVFRLWLSLSKNFNY